MQYKITLTFETDEPGTGSATVIFKGSNPVRVAESSKLMVDTVTQGARSQADAQVKDGEIFW